MIRKTLILEDEDKIGLQIEEAVREFFSSSEVDRTPFFMEAERIIGKTDYDLVFLDNAVLLGGDSPSSTCRRGYTLIDKIKEKNDKTMIVGTSSISPRGSSNPDYHLNKGFDADFVGQIGRISGWIKQRKDLI